jgi:tetratricopeptide (TPR) repeat protein
VEEVAGEQDSLRPEEKAGEMAMKTKLMMAAVLGLVLAPAVAMAQNDSSQGGIASAQGATLANKAGGAKGTVHGHAQNPIGLPYADTVVFATTDGSPKSAVAKFTTDANGDYTGQIPAGTYVFVLQEKNPKDPNKEIDDSGQVPVAEKSSVTVDFDGTRQAYLNKMSPEERKAMEETKAKNEKITAENNKIKNLNALLQQERDARKAGQMDQATQMATQITLGKPDEALGWYELGTDQVIQKKYTDAIPNLEKALQLNEAGKKNPQLEAGAEGQLGQAYAYSKRPDEGAKHYDAAAKADPTMAYTNFYNESVLMLQAGNPDQAAAAADKAIAVDPKQSLAYYVKGQALIQKAAVDASGKVVAPPGCVEAYTKYLELDPSGPHAAEVKGILQGIGATVPGTGKSARKK